MLRGARLLFVTIVLSISQLTVGQNTTPNPAERWLSHIQYLASDELAGRETGSEGHRRAAEYIAAAFKRAGWLQHRREQLPRRCGVAGQSALGRREHGHP